MSNSTFKPGMDEYTSSPEVDYDGTVYGGETIRRASTLSILHHDLDDVDEKPEETTLHVYHVFGNGTDSDSQVHAMRVLIVDSAGHDAWIDAVPSQLEHVGKWLIEQAQTLIPATQEAGQ